MELLPEARCGSYLVYIPYRSGGGELGAKSRWICYRLKQGKQKQIATVVEYLARNIAASSVSSVLAGDSVLVPMPRSAPLQSGALWPAALLARELVAQGMGVRVLKILERASRVQKSATAGSGMRPTAADHLASFRMSKLSIFPPRRIVIVDDVITTGATMLAATSALVEEFRDISVHGFAFFRTEHELPGRTIVSPVVSEIWLRDNGLTKRRP